MSKPRPLHGETTTIDSLMGGKLLVRQPVMGHRGGTDTMLLAAAAPSSSGTLLDLGAGVGIAGLAVAQRLGCGKLIMVEVQPDLAALARENIGLNGLEGRAEAICADALSAAARRQSGLANGVADVIITNPPFLTPGRSQTSPDPSRATAHSLADGGIESWLRAASALLRPDGRFVMIHRADALAAILPGLSRRFGAIELIAIHPREGEPAHRILLRGVRGSRAPLSLLPPLVIHAPQGGFTPRAAAIHAGEATL